MGFWTTPRYSRIDLIAIFMISSVIQIIVHSV